MTRLTITLALVALAACSEAVPPFTVTAIPAPPPPPFRGVLREISETYNGRKLNYDISVPSDGTLVGRLSWPVETPGQFWLTLEGQLFEADSSDLPKVVGRLAVEAGRNYRISVEFWADYDPWEYYGTDPFVLILSLE
jgi:hypothetical protein